MSNEPSRGRGWEPLPGKRQPTPVSDTLNTLASTLGLGSVAGIDKLFLSWPDVVGEDLATRCSPKRLTDGCLVVAAVDAQWATELSWMTDLIMERCNDALGEPAVSEVKISR